MNDTKPDPLKVYREELERLASIALSAPPRSTGNGRATYATNKPNWCKCGGTVATLPSGSQLWGCESCIQRDQRRREESRPVLSNVPTQTPTRGMTKIKDLY